MHESAYELADEVGDRQHQATDKHGHRYHCDDQVEKFNVVLQEGGQNRLLVVGNAPGKIRVLLPAGAILYLVPVHSLLQKWLKEIVSRQLECLIEILVVA
jgi:hypothetical protein